MNVKPSDQHNDIAHAVIQLEAVKVANRVFKEQGVAMPVNDNLREKVKYKLLEMN